MSTSEVVRTNPVTFSDFYQTYHQMRGRGGMASKSYYYDSQTLEALPTGVKKTLMNNRVDRSTAIELTRFSVIPDQLEREHEVQAMISKIQAERLSCRKARHAIHDRLAELGLRTPRPQVVAKQPVVKQTAPVAA